MRQLSVYGHKPHCALRIFHANNSTGRRHAIFASSDTRVGKFQDIKCVYNICAPAEPTPGEVADLYSRGRDSKCICWPLHARGAATNFYSGEFRARAAKYSLHVPRKGNTVFAFGRLNNLRCFKASDVTWRMEIFIFIVTLVQLPSARGAARSDS